MAILYVTVTVLKIPLYGRTCICFLAVVNVAYVTECVDIKSCKSCTVVSS